VYFKSYILLHSVDLNVLAFFSKPKEKKKRINFESTKKSLKFQGFFCDLYQKKL